jgi:hypothetical protein
MSGLYEMLIFALSVLWPFSPGKFERADALAVVAYRNAAPVPPIDKHPRCAGSAQGTTAAGQREAEFAQIGIAAVSANPAMAGLVDQMIHASACRLRKEPT